MYEPETKKRHDGNGLWGSNQMIYIWELNTDTGEYDKIGQLTDDREFVSGEDELIRIFPKEWWQNAEREMIMARLNNGHVMASYDDSDEEPTEPNNTPSA